MQTIDIKNLKADDIIRKCVHCGFCLATCPTYQLLGDELDSPRGRIYLIKSALEGRDFSRQSIKHLDRCLTCRSCETTCPSGVEYGQLVDIGRAFVEQKRPLWQRVYRYSVRQFLTTPILFNPVGRVLRHSKVRGASIKPLVKTGKVLLLGGCVQGVLAPNINHRIKNILAKLGYETTETPQKQCCGAIDQHLSASRDALIKIKRNIDTWLQVEATVIISSASGCGVMVKDYPALFDESDPYYQKAQYIANKTKDIAEFLVHQDLSRLNVKQVNISYHEPCTLQHGQKLGGLVDSILHSLGYQQMPVVDSHLCCGSAGTYSIFQPKLSKQLKINKLKNLTASNPEMIVTANIGCLMHLQKGTKIPVKHWVELLDI
ncbi:Glycolate dehydrogenase (EC, iron-sulfur subunit GlcF [Bathymodiolus thermophilus thioautotrophic gill symbiont]|uniref:glycolate oxidase subunit GlcF n=1 Tax=Bathymodiolus thermophilus thioautotrophic gill symbiont TaxID=2360 RepID=UPI00192C118D|nr:glycolate oxidase subunit GlcF [Bathymodiolus thermophilus thioautotrophic gill symbiont]CAB5498915.1 Glycolate dehydrogenase (EC, iron-sulfur subunit GlcF [Bathymodiolus thermophilus thioautotrophic gill symbiont]